MNNMMFSMYACDIRDVLKHVKEESLEILVGNAVRYIKRNTKYFSTCNWIAQELFFDVIPDELIGEIFNKKVFADDEDDIRLVNRLIILSEILLPMQSLTIDLRSTK